MYIGKGYYFIIHIIMIVENRGEKSPNNNNINNKTNIYKIIIKLHYLSSVTEV